METIKKLAVAILIIGSLQLTAQNNQAVLEAFTKSYSLENEGEYTKAIAQLKNVYDENSYEINLRLGWLNYLSGLFSESMPYYEKCILLKPLSIEARLGIVLPASSMGNWNQVEKRYREILEIDPENSLVNYRMGLIFYGREDYQAALNYFEKVVNHYPFDYDSVIMLAWTNYMMGKSREAKVLFQKALLNQPGSETALEGLSLIK